MQSVQEKDGSGMAQDAFCVKIEFVFFVCSLSFCVSWAVSILFPPVAQQEAEESSSPASLISHIQFITTSCQFAFDYPTNILICFVPSTVLGGGRQY